MSCLPEFVTVLFFCKNVTLAGFSHFKRPIGLFGRLSTFLRLDKLGCFEFCRDSGKSKLSGLVASLECRLFET